MIGSAKEPFVGIFWGLQTDKGLRLLIDQTPLHSAEAYGSCLTHLEGHYEVWERWRSEPVDTAVPDVWAIVRRYEYDEVPRGRVVYQKDERVFWIYADRSLLGPIVVAEIKALFGLEEVSCGLRMDPHYRISQFFG